MLSMILAMDRNKLVGKTNSKFGLPWHYPEDLQYYKEKTIGKINIMGSKTFEQIGKALPGRSTYVMTRDKSKSYEGVTMINSIEKILELQHKNPEEEIMIIGGVEIFRQLMKCIDVIYLTVIDDIHDGDVYYDDFTTDGFSLESSFLGQNNKIDFQVWRK